MSAAGIASLSATIAISLGYRLLSRCFPTTLPAPTAMPFDQLKAQYARWLNVMALFMAAASLPLTAVFSLLFLAMATLCASLLPPADVTIAPTMWWAWITPAFLLALNVSGFLAIWFVQWRLGSRYNEFLDFWSRSSHMNPIKANKVVAAICFGIVMVLVFFGLGWHVQLRGDVLAVRGYFSPVERDYALADLRSIKTAPRFVAPDGHTVARREFVITFSGGRRWTTQYIPSDMDEVGKRSFVQMLSERSGVPIDEVALLQRGDL